MAVPPAPDGDAVGDPSDSTDTTSTEPHSDATAGSSVPAWMLVGVLAVVLACLVASLVAFGRAGWSWNDLTDEQPNPQTQRDQVMAVAKKFATQVATYGPEDLDAQNRMPGYVERVEELLTPKFATGFEQSVTFAEQSVAQQQISRTAQVYAVGVSSIGNDSARVLVAGTDTVSAPNPKKPEELLPYSQQTFRFEVALVRTQGEWLVDNYGPVGTLDEPSGEQLEQLPTEIPTEEPTEPNRKERRDGGDGE